MATANLKVTSAPAAQNVRTIPGAPIAMPSRLGGLAGVKPRAQSEWLTPGEYLLRITSVSEAVTRPPAMRPYFKVEGVVVGNEDSDGSKGQNRVGHSIVWMVMLDRDGALKDVRAFLDAALSPANAALLDTDAADGVIADIVGETQPLRGRHIMCSAHNKVTKSGKDFTAVRWFTAPADMIPTP